MAAIEQVLGEPLSPPLEIYDLPLLEGKSAFEHDALLDAYRAEYRPPRVRRVLGEMAAAGLIAAPLGLTMLGAPLPPPEPGTVKPTLDGRFTIESSQHGSSDKSALSFPSDLPMGLGAKASFDDLPVNITKEGIVPTKIGPEETKLLAGFFANYDQYIGDGIENVLNYAEFYALIGAMGWLALRIIDGEVKQRGWDSKIPYKRLARMGLTAGLVYGSVSPPAIIQMNPVEGISASTEYTGAPSGVILSGGLAEFVQQRHLYFEQLSKSQKKALADISPVFSGQHVVTMLAIEGTGCDSVVTRLAGEAAHQLKPDEVLDAGDDGIGSSALDKYCLADSVAQLKGYDETVTLGNHNDPHSIIRDKWVTYLKGQAIERAGIRLNGGPDPETTEPLLNQLWQTGGETRRQASKRLADETCKDALEHPGQPSVFMSNQGSLGRDVLERRCATLVLSGGMKPGYKDNGTVSQYLLPRANGATPAFQREGISVKFPSDGGITYIGFDKQLGAIYIQPITYHKGGTVSADPSSLVIIPNAFTPSA